MSYWYQPRLNKWGKCSCIIRLPARKGEAQHMYLQIILSFFRQSCRIKASFTKNLRDQLFRHFVSTQLFPKMSQSEKIRISISLEILPRETETVVRYIYIYIYIMNRLSLQSLNRMAIYYGPAKLHSSLHEKCDTQDRSQFSSIRRLQNYRWHWKFPLI